MTSYLPDHLIPLNFVTEIIYPRRQIQNQTLIDLFNALSGPYGFLNLKLLPEGKGALFAGQKGHRCEILEDKTIVREDTNVISFENYCETTMALLEKILGELAPPVFVGQQNIVRMLYPLSSARAANQFLMESFLHVPDSLGQALGRPLAGIGLRLVFPPTQKTPNEFQLRIEPFFRDQTQLFVENMGRFFPPFRDLKEIRERLAATYDFLKASLQAML